MIIWEHDTHAFADQVDLASAALGARVVATDDDFFAEAANLLKPGEALFDPDAYTERGKLMDGWESRRKRGPGHDWVVVRLGAPGRLRGVDIDTQHFKGNHPPYASLEATRSDDDALEHAAWTPLLPQVPLAAHSHNIFGLQASEVFTHVRLNIFPDGGVARLRIYGEVEPDWRAHPDDETLADHVKPGEVDLAALRNGARPLACSDMFFSPMTNLVAPGRALHMGQGWESRRRRGPGFDWVVVRLARRGEVAFVEVDTNHFKGNFPDRCLIEGLDLADAQLVDLALDPSLPWRPLLPEQKLQAHTRHFYREQVQASGPITHARLSIFPDGGVSRLRLYGRVA